MGFCTKTFILYIREGRSLNPVVTLAVVHLVVVRCFLQYESIYR